MKPGGRIVNCARGGLIVEADLRAALDTGHVAGAAVDVFEVEPATDNVLFGSERLIATPHLGAASSEAPANLALQVAAQMTDFLLAGAVSNAVNISSLTAAAALPPLPYRAPADHTARLPRPRTTHRP